MRHIWNRFELFAPDGEQLDRIGVKLAMLGRAADTLLKAFMIGAWFYFAIEIGRGLLRHFGGR
jgi:hypothetical protein